MSDQQDVSQLKNKLQQQAAEFQSYKEQCKQIELMLEEDCQKKEEEIKQLKEESIKREKGEKMLKAQVSQLQAEVQNLKTQLGQSANDQSSANSHKEEVEKLTKQNTTLKEKNSQIQAKLQQHTVKVAQLQASLLQSIKKVESLSKSLSEAENRPTTIVSAPQTKESNQPKQQEEIKKLKEKLATLQKQKVKFQKLSKQRQSQIQKLRHDYEQKIRKLSESNNRNSKQRQQKPVKRQHSEQKQPNDTIPLNQHKLQLSKLKQTIHQLQQLLQKSQNAEKQTKQKLNNLMSDKQTLLQKIKNLQRELEKQREKRQQLVMTESPQKSPHKDIFIEESADHLQSHQQASTRMDCLLLTKRHYISPFIDIKDNKLIKVYKSTKNGFEKSLGATRHKFDSVGYDVEAIVQNGIGFAKESIQRGNSHTILLYGSKRTSKKYLMAAIVKDLKEWLLEKVDEQLEESEENVGVHCLYMKRSADEERNYLKEATSNKEEIIQILQEIIAMGSPSSPTKSQPKQKKTQKPKVRYFSITFGQGPSLQIITTSYLNPFIKNNETFIDYINTIVFSKLPNILQSSLTNYHIITTINPIVNLYEECKNTLSITVVPLKDNSLNQMEQSQADSRFLNSPQGINKEDLNDQTKKKLESFEKQTEQAGLKARKSEDECNYFRSRFQELQIRLKNLINTHQQQNTYLKKSPVTLSYQKLLKFVISVLTRNTTSYSRGNISPNFAQTASDEYQNQVEMYIQEDAKSVDGY